MKPKIKTNFIIVKKKDRMKRSFLKIIKAN